MNAVCRFALAAVLCWLPAPAVGAQQPAPPAKDPQAAEKPEQKPAPKPEQKPDEPQKYEETVVVSASRTEEKLINAPATVTVIGSQTIASAPTQNLSLIHISEPTRLGMIS